MKVGITSCCSVVLVGCSTVLALFATNSVSSTGEVGNQILEDQDYTL